MSNVFFLFSLGLPHLKSLSKKVLISLRTKEEKIQFAVEALRRNGGSQK